MRRRRIALVASLIAAASPATASAAHAFTLYSVQAAVPASAQGSVDALNNPGVAVGWADGVGPPGLGSPFSWSPGGEPVDDNPLSETGDYQGGATSDINDSGDTVGADEYGPSTSSLTASGWAMIGGVLHTYATNDSPDWISPDDLVVGNTLNPVNLSPTGGFYSIDGGAPVLLGDDLAGVNSSDVMIGRDSSGRGAYWTLSGTTPTEHVLPVPAADTGMSDDPTRINAGGVIVGYVRNSLGGIVDEFEAQVGGGTATSIPGAGPNVQISALSDTDVLARGDDSGTETLTNLDSGFSAPLAGLIPSAWSEPWIATFNDMGDAGGYVRHPPSQVARPAIFVPIGARVPSQPQLIPRLIPLPEDPLVMVPLTLRWAAKAPAADPITRETVQVSSDAGKTWTTEKLAKPAATSLNFTFSPGVSYEVRVASTDSLNNTSAWTKAEQFTPQLTDQTASSVVYGGPFTIVKDPKAVGGSLAETDTNGAAVAYTFTGSQVGIVARVSAKPGSVEVFIDGQDQGALNFGPSKTKERDVVAGYTLSPGSHTIKLVAAGDGPVYVDGFTTVS